MLYSYQLNRIEALFILIEGVTYYQEYLNIDFENDKNIYIYHTGVTVQERD